MTIQELLTRFKSLKAERAPWDPHYQLIAEYMLTRKQDITNQPSPGGYAIRPTFTNAGMEAAQTAASMFLSLLWPDSSRTFVLRPAAFLANVEAAREFFSRCTDILASLMDDADTGLQLALNEYMLDQMVFGHSGIFVKDEEDTASPLSYRAYGAKGLYIAEDHKGFVNEAWYERTLTAQQVVDEYGKENVSKRVRTAVDGGRPGEKVTVVFAVFPRRDKSSPIPNQKMDYAAVHFEADGEGKLLKESGFESMPILVGRFATAAAEVYGRSPGMIALPLVVELNVQEETNTLATELKLRPPLGVLDDGRLGGGVIDTSPGAINVFNPTGVGANANPVFPILPDNVDMRPSLELREQLLEGIARAFFLDRLLDLNSTTQMTAYETSVRNKIRGESLSGPLSRQEVEVLKRLIERSFDIVWKRGLFGIDPADPRHKAIQAKYAALGAEMEVIPDVVLRAASAGVPVYTVEFINPAKRFRQSEKMQGLITATDYANAVAAVKPDIWDNIDSDLTFKKVVELSGAPVALRPSEEVGKIRQERQQAQAAAAMAEQAKLTSEADKNLAQAASIGAPSGAGR